MTNFTYSFPTMPPNPAGLIPFSSIYNQVFANMTPYSLPATGGFYRALEMWSNVANINFQSGNSATNNISFAYTNSSSTGSATTFGVGGNFNSATNFWVFLNTNYNLIDPNGPADYMISAPTFINWGVWNLAHEIGHTLLGDGHTTGLSGTNDLRFSIMGYPQNHPIGSALFPNDVGMPIPLTPGMTNINLVQNGGTNPLNNKLVTAHGQGTAQDGNTSYVFTETSVKLGTTGASVNGDPEKYVMTLWDRPVAAGGIDTIDTWYDH